jgi:hypothetical protein
MPKKMNPLTPQEQRKRFEAEVQRLIDAGELSPTDADAALDNLVRRSAIQSEPR